MDKLLITIFLLLFSSSIYADEKNCIKCIRPLDGLVQDIGIDLFMMNAAIWDKYIKQTHSKEINNKEYIDIDTVKLLANQIKDFIDQTDLTINQQAKLLKTLSGLAGDIANRTNAFWSPSEKTKWGKISYTSTKKAMEIQPDSPFYAYNFIFTVKSTIKAAGSFQGFLEDGLKVKFSDEIKLGHEYLNRYPTSRTRNYKRRLKKKFSN